MLRHFRRPAAPGPLPAGSRRRRRILALLVVVLLGTVTGVVLGGLIAWVLRGGRAVLDGDITTRERLTAEVRIDRDDRGIPTLHASNRQDLAFATGFVHGQDRFFQMDLLRRRAAGELAELFGSALLAEDTRLRVHRFRARATAALKQIPAEERQLLQSYTAGVEAGRRAVRGRPWEYRLLGAEARAWREEDIGLVVLGMYIILQEDNVGHERMLAIMADELPPALAEFLSPQGSSWDAPLLGKAFADPVIPSADDIDLRKRPALWKPVAALPQEHAPRGSNNWAIAGQRSTHGGAMVANDMHLGLFAPNIWYRTAFELPDRRVIGVTLPGTPAMVVGSNTHLAWGFTNVEGDFADLVVLEEDGARYRVGEKWQEFTRHAEVIQVRGGPSVPLDVEETIWGPVVDTDHRGRKRALRWVAHDPEAVNLRLLRLETAKTVAEAVEIAAECGTPGQNVVFADKAGDIAWTILGRVPVRFGHDGRRPSSWADGKRGWKGWLSAKDRPRVVRPAEGLLWTANNRTLADPQRALIGQDSYDHGARAKQIRDGLRQRDKLKESDCLAIHLDDRALFAERWQKLLLEVLGQGEEHQQVRRAVKDWGGRALPESVGFRVVKRFQQETRRLVLGSLLAPCLRAEPRANQWRMSANVDESLWQLVTKRPAHLLPPGHASWEALLGTAVERVVAEVRKPSLSFADALSRYTWGAQNRPRIRHVLSGGVGPAALWLGWNMPEDGLPGDKRAMPRIQGSRDGASQRMAVSPGREELGYFHMPAGQSGHPLSPHYRDGHADWAQGRASPFLPGEMKHRLRVRPAP